MLALVAVSALFASAFIVIGSYWVPAASWLSTDDLHFTNEEIDQALREYSERLEA